MSDQNRIPLLGQPPSGGNPVKIDMVIDGNAIVVTFEPPATLLRFTQRSARNLAIALLQRCEYIDNPPMDLDQ